MKKILFCGVICSIMFGACTNANTNGTATDHSDTAVLVRDTNNSLNAKPVNDTTVHEHVDSTPMH